MNLEQQAYEAGYYRGYEKAREEAIAAIGPGHFPPGQTIAGGIKRRDRINFWIRVVVDMVIGFFFFLAFFMFLTYAHDLQQRSSNCICVGENK